jgi:hypothetical protein
MSATLSKKKLNIHYTIPWDDGRTDGRTDRQTDRLDGKNSGFSQFCGQIPFSCTFFPAKKDVLTYCQLLKYRTLSSFRQLSYSLPLKIPLASIPREENSVVPVHKFQSCFSRIHFNNILTFTLWPSDLFLPRTVFRIFPNALKNFFCVFIINQKEKQSIYNLMWWCITMTW